MPLRKEYMMILRQVEFERDVELDIIAPSIKADNKKIMLEKAAQIISDHYRLPFSSVLDYLEITIERDNTSMGDGVVIPAMTLKNIRKPATILLRLDRAISYDSIDGQPIDIVCFVLSPEHDKPAHLRRLSRISRLMKNKELISKIRETNDSETIQALIHSPEGWMMAA